MDTSEKIDVSQYTNILDVMHDLKRQVGDIELELQRLGSRKKAAQELLASAESSVYERREAEAVLCECEKRGAKYKAGLARAEGLITLKEGQLKVMQPEWDRQQARLKAVSQMRSRM
jgi:predicted  nucleic acid-binding Zn-ribbon protein